MHFESFAKQTDVSTERAATIILDLNLNLSPNLKRNLNLEKLKSQ
jgi:hypothetical protein